MRFTRNNGEILIFCENEETEQEVLRAIAKATFETAISYRMGLLQYNPNTILSDSDVDEWINLDQEHVLNLDYIEGRQVKTRIDRNEEGQLVLYEEFYRTRRGATPDVMLTRAQELLAGAEPKGHCDSYSFIFQGENLDLFLVEMGMERKPNENDWDFRKRIFPDMWTQDRDHAIMVLFGGFPLTDFNEFDKMLVLALFFDKPSRTGLVDFAEGFAADPQVIREDVADFAQ